MILLLQYHEKDMKTVYTLDDDGVLYPHRKRE